MSDVMKGAEQLNVAVDVFSLALTRQLNDNITGLGIVDTGKLFKSLRYRIRYLAGEADMISWSAPRYGFVLTNVGRGYTYQVTNGAKIARKTGQNPNKKRVLIKGQGDLDWIFKELATGSEKLADLLAEINANRVVAATTILSTANKK